MTGNNTHNTHTNPTATKEASRVLLLELMQACFDLAALSQVESQEVLSGINESLQDLLSEANGQLATLTKPATGGAIEHSKAAEIDTRQTFKVTDRHGSSSIVWASSWREAKVKAAADLYCRHWVELLVTEWPPLLDDNEQAIRDAINRSISHTETVHVTVLAPPEGIHALMAAVTADQWDYSPENDDEQGRTVLDVYSLVADQWRIKVTFRS